MTSQGCTRTIWRVKMVSMIEYTLDEVLHAVNDMRVYQFSLSALQSLPKGKQLCAEHCIIANCFPEGCFTDGSFLYTNESEVEIELPDIIVEFITDFDNGEWPGLVSDD